MNELLTEGLSAMCIGMGTVFSFLCITIVAMIVMSNCIKYLNTIFPEAVATPASAPAKSTSSDEEIALAVAVAVNAR